MKVFSFLFCIALASGDNYGENDEEDLRAFLQNPPKTIGVHSAPECSERKISVNGNPFTILFNEAECPQDKYKGDNVVRVGNDGTIKTNDDKNVTLTGRSGIDEEVFSQVFPGFVQSTTTTPPPTTRKQRMPPANTAAVETDTNTGNHAGLSSFIATLIFLKQMI